MKAFVILCLIINLAVSNAFWDRIKSWKARLFRECKRHKNETSCKDSRKCAWCEVSYDNRGHQCYRSTILKKEKLCKTKEFERWQEKWTDTLDQYNELKKEDKKTLQRVIYFNDEKQKFKKFNKEFQGDQDGKAEFLFEQSQPDVKDILALDRKRLGLYLAEEKKENGNVLTKFVEKFNFEKLHFLDAQREFLKCFLLPGEAQQIDRIMDAFGKGIGCEGNKKSLDSEQFSNCDVPDILAYSTTMLNTDAHNPSIKEENKMTEEQFIRNNRGINDGENLDEDFLKGIYASIKETEFDNFAESGKQKSPKYSIFYNELQELLNNDPDVNTRP